jgi:hypothetical protein
VPQPPDESEVFRAFEQEMADVPDPWDEVPGVSVDLGLVEHLEEIIAHFMSHVIPHLGLAIQSGMDTVAYPMSRTGATIRCRATEYEVLIRYSIPPDVGEDMRRKMEDEL